MTDFIYALDAGGSFLKCGLFPLDPSADLSTHIFGAPLEGSLDSEPVDSSSGSPESIRAAYGALAARAKARATAAGGRIAAVGMDTPGPFDYASGTFRMTHKYAALYGVSVLPWFAADFPALKPVIVHDSEAFILGAAADLPCRRRIAGVMLGTGLGFALYEDGQVLRREDGGPRVSIYASEFHGGRAEDRLSARGVVAAYRAITGSDDAQPLSALDVAYAAHRGDTAAIEAYASTGRLLGELLCPILDAHKSEALVIGGQISRDFPLFGNELKAALAGLPALTAVIPAKNIDTVHLRGAAAAAAAARGKQNT